MTRVLVAGGAGFIGSHLCEALVARGDEVVAVDSLVTGSVDNLVSLRDHPRLRLEVADVTAPLELEGPFDLVMNMASPASPIDFVDLNVEIMLAGSIGTKNLLDIAVRDGARFFLASTSEVYGEPAVHPQPETYFGNVDTIGVRGCYDEAKRFAEAMTMAYRRRHGVDVRIARIFNTYGPRMKPADGRVVTNFFMAALAGEPLLLYGGGLQTRSFCFVGDEVRGLLAFADASAASIEGPVNVGSDREFSVREIAELVVELTGSRSRIEIAPMPLERTGDPSLRRPDLTRARALFGWEPVVGLREGLQHTLDWLRPRIEANAPRHEA